MHVGDKTITETEIYVLPIKYTIVLLENNNNNGQSLHVTRASACSFVVNYTFPDYLISTGRLPYRECRVMSREGQYPIAQTLATRISINLDIKFFIIDISN